MRNALAGVLQETSLSNPSLLLQRYIVPSSDRSGVSSAAKQELYERVLGAARSPALHLIYSAAYDRWNRSFAAAETSKKLVATQSRLISGLGSQNVLEAGLRLHHTYGVPLIPGSALKGVASHFCHEVWGDSSEDRPSTDKAAFRRDGAYHRSLFGSTDDTGLITFHDAWITPDSISRAFCLDVMTPHHRDWNAGGNEETRVPSDFDSPVPISFLSVNGEFDVRITWKGPTDVDSDVRTKWLGLAMALLLQALGDWGVGGKTSSGYGRLIERDSNAIPGTTPHQKKAAVTVNNGDIVEVTLLAEKTKKGGWKALHEASGLTGHFQNDNGLADKTDGERLLVKVFSANTQAMIFTYPIPEDRQDTAKKMRPKTRPSR